MCLLMQIEKKKKKKRELLRHMHLSTKAESPKANYPSFLENTLRLYLPVGGEKVLSPQCCSKAFRASLRCLLFYLPSLVPFNLLSQ